MPPDGGLVEVDESPDGVPHQGGHEHGVQADVVVVEDVPLEKINSHLSARTGCAGTFFLLQLHSVVAEFRKAAREPLQQHAFVTQSNSLSETTCGPAAFLDSILTVAMSAGTSAATGSQRKIANFLLKICKISTEFFYYTKAVSQVNFFRLFFEPFF